jgi:hypothetical protein
MRTLLSCLSLVLLDVACSAGGLVGDQNADHGVAHPGTAGSDAGVTGTGKADTGAAPATGHDGGGVNPSGHDSGASSHADAGESIDAGGTVDGALGDVQATAPVQVSCQSVDLAVLTFDSAPTELLVDAELVIGGTVTPGVNATLSSVDIVSGSTVVHHFAGGGEIAVGTSQLLAAAINPPSAITQHCSSDAPADRFDVFQVVVTGTLVGTGAPFSTTCASLGAPYPPTVVETCHKNFDYPPLVAIAQVTDSVVSGETTATTEFQSETAIGSGGAIQSITNSLFVIPTDTTLAPENTTGWTASASVVNDLSHPPFNVVEFESWTSPFGALCGWDAGATPAFFIARFNGTNGYGAFSSEGIVQLCGKLSQ